MDSSVKRYSAEEEIRLLRRISEKSPDAVIRIDADGNILYANPAGRSLIECWNSGIGQFAPDRWKQRIANTLASGKSQETEIECGEMVISFHVVPMPDDSCVILYGRDVTERKHTEHDLRQNEERFALVLRGTNDGIWDFDLRTGEIQFSSRWEEMLGYQENEIANHFKAWQDLIHPEDLGQVLEVWMECMEGLTESFATEYRIRTKSGDWMWVQCRGLALQDADQSPIRLAGSHTDITDRKQAEFLQNRYHEGLVKLDKWVRELISVAGQSQKFFDLVCNGISDLVNADLSALPMIDRSGDTFTYVAATGTMAKLVHNQTMLVQGGGLCGWVAEHGETLRATDLANDPRVNSQFARTLQVTTALLVPIRQTNQVVGGLSAFRKAVPFDDIDEQLLTLFGQRVSAALDNLRLLVTLEDQKERAQVTLQSIGDAVITTDNKGRINYMNPVAEQLTAWRNDEAKGLPATDVLHIIHETTREPVLNPVQECLREERSIELSSNTVLISRNGKEFAIEDAVAPLRNRKGEVVGAVMVLDNVSEERELRNQLSWQATHDALTGLFNRREFERRLGQALANACMDNNPHALLYLDLDQFKIVNDTCGHVAGDILLKQLATILEDKLRQADIVARLGGDEFGVLLNHCPIEQAKQIADTLRQSIKRCQFLWEGKTFEVGVSIGVAPITADSGTQNDVMSAVDMACYAAKDLGRNRIYVYREEDSDLARRHVEMQWVTRINEALEANRFRLYYQNMVPSASHTSEGEHYEILLRMLDEDGNIVLPMDFIPSAERYNLMPAIDRWVISNTFAIIGTEQNALDDLATCSINLSGVSLGDESILHFIREQLLEYGIPPNVICFEVTETAAIANLSQAVQFITELKELGCRFALDDFGSGLSSFAYLQTLPVDYLKIDGDFVRDMVSNPVDCAMVKSINEVGHAMGKQTIAEWAEDDATLQRLKEIGVDYAQGYAIGKPQPFPRASGASSKIGSDSGQSTHPVTRHLDDSKLAS